MRKSKQIIVIRKDLNMRKGKMVAQGAHASMKAILDLMIDLPGEGETTLIYGEDEALQNWIEGIFTKICVSVDSESELLGIYEVARASGLICSLIQDIGLTEFDGVPTYTACAVGPAWEEECNAITGHLKLL